MSKKKKSKKLKKAAKAKLAKLDKKLLSASDALLTISVDTGKKWNKLFKQSITVAEPIREKQIDMFFDTTDAVRDQIEEGAERFKKLLGIEENIVDLIQKKINKSEVAKQLTNSASKLVSVVTEAGLKDSIEKGAVKIKMEITERFSGKKKKAKKKSTKKKSTKKKAAVKSKVKTVKKKSPAKAKASPAKKATAKKATAKGKTSAAKMTTAKKATVAKKASGAKRGPKPGTKRKVTATVKKVTTGKKRGPKPSLAKAGGDDLKKIIGIGAKMEKILNRKGIKTYNQLKSTTIKDLQGIINGAGGYYQSYKPQTWKAEAALAAAGKFDKMLSGRR